MSRPVRVHPIFYARLQLVLSRFENSVDAEVEFVGRHLVGVETAFAEHWDALPGPPGSPAIRWVGGGFDAIPALFMIEGRLTDAGVIELRNIRLVIDPDAG